MLLLLAENDKRNDKKDKGKIPQNSTYQQGAKEWFKSVNEQGKNAQAKDDNSEEDINRILKYWSEKWINGITEIVGEDE